VTTIIYAQTNIKTKTHTTNKCQCTCIQSSYTKTSKTGVTQYGKIQLLLNMHKISDITQQSYIEHANEHFTGS